MTHPAPPIPHTEAPALAMPVGGIGTGGFAVNADGSLRQWQLHGIPNHRGALPLSGFWLRTTQIEPPLDEIRMLQAAPVADPRAPLVTDGEVPEWMLDAAGRVGTFAEARFSGVYPFAEVSLADPAIPLAVRMRVLNPMEPLDAEVSAIPTGMFEFALTNTGDVAVHGTLAGSLLNAVGWDGVTPIGTDLTASGLGGNVNRFSRGRGWARVAMDNPNYREDDAAAGQMLLAADDESAAAMPRCGSLAELRAFLESRALNDGRAKAAAAATIPDPQLHAPRGGTGPSPAGRSWAAVIGVPFWIEPGQTRRVRFAMTWWFPNRFVDVEQFGRPHGEWGASRFWIGNRYATRFADAADAFEHVARDWEGLVARTEAWTATLAGGELDVRTVERMAAQAIVVRSPTCFRGADGRFYGYEGSLGASTTMWSGVFGGSCPLNCTHVWQYEAALAALWPELERDMRDTEFDVLQAPDGSIPHRLRVPVYLPQMQHEDVGGPEESALDGMLATILKSLRDVRRGAGLDWLERRWPALTRLYTHICRKWDIRDDGVLRGIQSSTHDIDLAGVNPFMGSLWLAALRALEELARLVGDEQTAVDARARFERGTAAYDATLFDGRHYIQKLDDGDPVEYQWLTGVLSDQLVGQWWAHQLGLGHILPAEHVRSALRHIVRVNLRHGFDGFRHPYRVYADAADDSGLLMCSWPDGGRPEVPTRYADEVWCGSEYQIAAHCLFEGLVDEGRAVLDALWTRTDGRRRNPYNDIECGDHYVRAMAGWTVLDALTGIRWDAVAGTLALTRAGRFPWLTSTGFGVVDAAADAVTLHCHGGTLDAEVVLGADDAARSLGRVSLAAGESHRLGSAC
ncbi:GH116 family glycosyl-hydrolase [Agromyces archimandritae]|uniref:Uncharacterized protein n=1 Tax=Agromyces archimandritae TaxID=2781962 RepID=A0A975FK04_9MICO|nr:GH116 family glycosyl-hydrolase [Agromyces archimandritae]QTX03389.1 hypothetical protein G127AT_08350 [Agromyces archimandritae]